MESVRFDVPNEKGLAWFFGRFMLTREKRKSLTHFKGYLGVHAKRVRNCHEQAIVGADHY